MARRMSTQDGTSQTGQGQNDVQSTVDQAAQQAGQQATNASDVEAQIKNKSSNHWGSVKSVRTKTCSSADINSDDASRGAESVKKSLDTMYMRVVAFYENGQLTVADFWAKIKAIELTKANSGSTDDSAPNEERSEVVRWREDSLRLEGDRLSGQGVKTTLKNSPQNGIGSDLISSMRSASATEGTSNE